MVAPVANLVAIDDPIAAKPFAPLGRNVTATGLAREASLVPAKQLTGQRGKLGAVAHLQPISRPVAASADTLARLNDAQGIAA